ncbi:rho gtpase activation protein [Anaeramoeba flamelloides]|uniref:Rho gtpase activation protein n=1 Tax=Anaeramoeba flamelloides TaxID=1746091 RepID=A0ABQ8Y5C0_9EUKA|nr:rho gtpase activation protein [Anaeramoeba flamelloides]
MNYKKVDFCYVLWNEKYDLPYYFHPETEHSTWIKPQTGFFISVVETQKLFGKKKAFEHLQEIVKQLPTKYYKTKGNFITDFEFLKKYQKLVDSKELPQNTASNAKIVLTDQTKNDQKNANEKKNQVQEQQQNSSGGEETTSSINKKTHQEHESEQEKENEQEQGNENQEEEKQKEIDNKHKQELELGVESGPEYEAENDNENGQEFIPLPDLNELPPLPDEMLDEISDETLPLPLDTDEIPLPDNLPIPELDYDEEYSDQYEEEEEEGEEDSDEEDQEQEEDESGFVLEFFNQKSTALNKRMEHQLAPIETSLINFQNSTYSEMAVEVFKNLMIYMGEIVTKEKSDILAISDIIKMGLKTPELRDEIYVQAVKQTTKNPNKHSEIKGWAAFCILIHSFLPSQEFQPKIVQYFEKHTKSERSKIRGYARYGLRSFRSTLKKKKQYEIPKFEIIKNIHELPFRPAVFGISLDQLSEDQEKEGITTLIPKVLLYLYQNIQKNGGFQTESIFKNNIDDEKQVKMLKSEIDKGNYLTNESDPSVYASLLQLFFRELEPPIIPYTFNKILLSNNCKWNRLQLILQKLPYQNRVIFASFIQFCQKITQQKYVDKTQTGIEEISTIFAPYLIRKPYYDKELKTLSEKDSKLVIATIIQNWDVSVSQK